MTVVLGRHSKSGRRGASLTGGWESIFAYAVQILHWDTCAPSSEWSMTPGVLSSARRNVSATVTAPRPDSSPQVSRFFTRSSFCGRETGHNCELPPLQCETLGRGPLSLAENRNNLHDLRSCFSSRNYHR